MKAIHKKRLLKLAEHLESGKLGHNKFDFSVINCDLVGDAIKDTLFMCGTMGCAMGELPVCFPRAWTFGGIDFPVKLRDGSSYDWHIDVREWFSIVREEMYHLFHPDSQIPSLYSGKHLTGKATAKQVAANIRAFVKKKESVS